MIHQSQSSHLPCELVLIFNISNPSWKSSSSNDDVDYSLLEPLRVGHSAHTHQCAPLPNRAQIGIYASFTTWWYLGQEFLPFVNWFQNMSITCRVETAMISPSILTKIYAETLETTTLIFALFFFLQVRLKITRDGSSEIHPPQVLII